MYDTGDTDVLNVPLGGKVVFYTWSLEGCKPHTADRQHMVIYVVGVGNTSLAVVLTSISSIMKLWDFKKDREGRFHPK